jgi:hypothetical protein
MDLVTFLVDSVSWSRLLGRLARPTGQLPGKQRNRKYDLDSAHAGQLGFDPISEAGRRVTARPVQLRVSLCVVALADWQGQCDRHEAVLFNLQHTKSLLSGASR